MAFRTNYGFERRERDRLKQAKKEEKQRRQQERKAQRGDGSADDAPNPPEGEEKARSEP